MAKLYFYYSSMNAGKTTTLLQSSYNYRERGMNTFVLTPELDTRHGTGTVTSRIGLEAAATMFSPAYFEREYFERFARVVAAYHAEGMKVIFHSDGNLNGIMDGLVAAGIDVLNADVLVKVEGLSRLGGLRPQAGTNGIISKRVGTTPIAGEEPVNRARAVDLKHVEEGHLLWLKEYPVIVLARHLLAVT